MVAKDVPVATPEEVAEALDVMARLLEGIKRPASVAGIELEPVGDMLVVKWKGLKVSVGRARGSERKDDEDEFVEWRFVKGRWQLVEKQ